MSEYGPGHVSHVGSNNGEELVPGEAKKISVMILLLIIKVAEDDTTLRCLALHLTSALEGDTSPPFTEETEAQVRQLAPCRAVHDGGAASLSAPWGRRMAGLSLCCLAKEAVSKESELSSGWKAGRTRAQNDGTCPRRMGRMGCDNRERWWNRKTPGESLSPPNCRTGGHGYSQYAGTCSQGFTHIHSLNPPSLMDRELPDLRGELWFASLLSSRRLI